MSISISPRRRIPDVFAHGMLVMAYLGCGVDRRGQPRQHSLVLDALAAITQLKMPDLRRSHFIELLDHEGVKGAKLALVTKDENGEIKLVGEAIIAL